MSNQALAPAGACLLVGSAEGDEPATAAKAGSLPRRPLLLPLRLRRACQPPLPGGGAPFTVLEAVAAAARRLLQRPNVTWFVSHP